MPSSADEAMSRYADGDDAAFEIVYETVAPRLVTFLRRRARDPHRIEDIVQQTFLNMHAARGTFLEGAEVLPWAFVIARRLMIDSSRRNWREDSVDLTDESDNSSAPFAGPGTTAEAMLQARETGTRLAAAYGRLSEPQRRAFELVKWGGISQAQAASLLGTTVTGIKLRVHRAYVALRAAVTDGGCDGGDSDRAQVSAVVGMSTHPTDVVRGESRQRRSSAAIGGRQ